MILAQIIFCANLCISIAALQQQAQNATNSLSTEDLIDAYYTTTPTESDQIIQQDETDAQAIWDSGLSEEVIASILPYREKPRRFNINGRILAKISGVRRRKRIWITQSREPPMESNFAFKNSCFALIEDENIVLSAYLANFFRNRDETFIIITMVLIKDMQNMIRTYEYIHTTKIYELRKLQRHPFENMLRRWVRKNREPIEKEPLNQNSITQDVNALKTEQQNGGWHEKRHQIEIILMWKSIKYARAVIQQFEKENGGKPIENIITDSVQTNKLNHDLADAYAFLARYIKDKYSFIADILKNYGDAYGWTAWIMFIAAIHPKEWPLVDTAYRKINNNESLSQTIIKKIQDDKVKAEMMAVIVDSNFKPTLFKEKPVQNSSLPPAVPGVGAPPPVTHTSMAPANDPSV